MKPETYWESPYAKAGMYVLVCGPDVMKLMVPVGRRFEIDLGEMRGAKSAALVRVDETVVLTFDDGTSRPFQIRLDAGQLKPAPLLEHNGRTYTLTVMVKGPREVFTLSLTYQDERRHASLRAGEPR